MINQFSKKVGKRGKGLAHFDYAHAIGKFEYKSNEIVSSDFANMPYWAKDDPRIFWKSADEFERANGNSYLEHQFALPRELNAEQWKAFVDDWCKEQFGDKHPYSYAIHCPMGSDGLPNPHVHLMYSERTLDEHDRPPEQFFKRYNSKHPERGGARKDVQAKTTTERKNELKELRHNWGEKVKECLRSYGFDQSAEKVDMRNWRERGLSEPPKNKTLKQINMEKRLADMVGVSSYDFKQEKEQDFDQSRVDDINRRIAERKRDIARLGQLGNGLADEIKRASDTSRRDKQVSSELARQTGRFERQIEQRERAIDSSTQAIERHQREFEQRKSTLDETVQGYKDTLYRVRAKDSDPDERERQLASTAQAIERHQREFDSRKSTLERLTQRLSEQVQRIREQISELVEKLKKEQAPPPPPPIEPKPKLTPEQELEQLKAKLPENDKVKVEAMRRVLVYQAKEMGLPLDTVYNKINTAIKDGTVSKLPDVPQQVAQQNVEIKLPKSSDKNKGFER